jgi:hypothetical protein
MADWMQTNRWDLNDLPIILNLVARKVSIKIGAAGVTPTTLKWYPAGWNALLSGWKVPGCL